MTRTTTQQRTIVGGVVGVLIMVLSAAYAQETAKQPALPKNATVKPPAVAPEDFSSVMTRMQAAKPAIH